MKIAPVKELKNGKGLTQDTFSLAANTVQPFHFNVARDSKLCFFKFIMDHTGDTGPFAATISILPGDMNSVARYIGRQTGNNQPWGQYSDTGVSGSFDLDPSQDYYVNVWATDGKAHNVDLGHQNGN